MMPPQPPGMPVLGHLPAFLQDKLGFFERCAARYGDLVRLQIGTLSYLMSHPDDIRHVLVSNADNYEKTPRLTGPQGRRALGATLLTTPNDMHLRQRRLLQPLYQQRALEVYVDLIAASVDEMLSGWRAGAVVDVAREMKALAQNVMLKMLLGRDFADEAGALGRAVSARRAYFEHMLGSAFPFPAYVPSRARLGYVGVSSRLEARIREAIRARRAGPAVAPDILSAYMQARFEDGTPISERQIVDEAIAFMDTGYETIAAALAWTWRLLAGHADVQARVAAEARQALNGRLPEPDDVRRLPYTGLALAEAMRLYPPTWMFVRVARQADTLPRGQRLPAGAKLYLCQYVAQRDARFFPQPERFDPQRFDGPDSSHRPRFAYFPFGGGPHVCLGEPLARLECLVVLAAVSQYFHLEPVPNRSVTPRAGITLRPATGVWVRLQQRGSRGSPSLPLPPPAASAQ